MELFDKTITFGELLGHGFFIILTFGYICLSKKIYSWFDKNKKLMLEDDLLGLVTMVCLYIYYNVTAFLTVVLCKIMYNTYKDDPDVIFAIGIMYGIIISNILFLIKVKGYNNGKTNVKKM